MEAQMKQMQEVLGDKMKYLGGVVNPLTVEQVSKIQDILKYFTIRNNNDKDSRSENLTLYGIFNEETNNWEVANEKGVDPSFFYPIWNQLSEIGLLSSDYTSVKIEMVLATRLAASKLPPPPESSHSRIIYNLFQPQTFFFYSDEKCTSESFFVRKFIDKNSFVVLGGSGVFNYYVSSKGGPKVLVPNQFDMSSQRSNRDKIKLKVKNYNRVTFILDILADVERPDLVKRMDQNVNALKHFGKKRNRKQKNKSLENSTPPNQELDLEQSEKETLLSIKKDLAEFVSQNSESLSDMVKPSQ